MKKLILLIAILFSLGTQGQLVLNSDIVTYSQRSVDGKQYKLVNGKHEPYTTPLQFLSTIPDTRRHIGEIGYIYDDTEKNSISTWMFVGGIADSNFAKVQSSDGSVNDLDYGISAKLVITDGVAGIQITEYDSILSDRVSFINFPNESGKTVLSVGGRTPDENGNIPFAIDSSGGASIQPDWLQDSLPNAPDYIKNKLNLIQGSGILLTGSPNNLVISTTNCDVAPLRTKVLESASNPTTSDIESGYSAIYKNTTSGLTYLWVNSGGTMIKVQLQ